jgi:hypothetical protein
VKKLRSPPIAFEAIGAGTSSAAACRPTSPPGFAGPPTGTDRTRSAPSAPTKSGPADPPRITTPAGLRNLAPRTFGKILSRPGRRWKPGVRGRRRFMRPATGLVNALEVYRTAGHLAGGYFLRAQVHRRCHVVVFLSLLSSSSI